jgi:hypothetical protein
MKCPSCKKTISTPSAQIVEMQLGGSGGTNIRGVVYACQHCQTILSVQADPMALNADLVSKLRRPS